MNTLTLYLTSQGINPDFLSYLILAPLIATLVSFSRHIIGIKGLGIYPPLLISFAFVGLGITKGIIVFLSIIILANFFAYLLKRFPLLYLPRTTIIIASISLTLLLLLFFLYLGQISLTFSSFLPIVMILALSDKFISIQIRKNPKAAFWIIIQTLALAVAGFYLLSWHLLRSWSLNYPVIILASIILVNVLIGKFSGLRLVELFRFRRLIFFRR